MLSSLDASDVLWAIDWQAWTLSSIASTLMPRYTTFWHRRDAIIFDRSIWPLCLHDRLGAPVWLWLRAVRVAPGIEQMRTRMQEGRRLYEARRTTTCPPCDWGDLPCYVEASWFSHDAPSYCFLPPWAYHSWDPRPCLDRIAATVYGYE